MHFCRPTLSTMRGSVMPCGACGALSYFPMHLRWWRQNYTILYKGTRRVWQRMTYLTGTVQVLIEIERVVQEVLVSCAVSEQGTFSTTLATRHCDLADPGYQYPHQIEDSHSVPLNTSSLAHPFQFWHPSNSGTSCKSGPLILARGRAHHRTCQPDLQNLYAVRMIDYISVQLLGSNLHNLRSR